MNKWVRQVHRWVSMLFTLAVVVTTGMLMQQKPPLWVSYLPLPPLFVLLFTGIYLFALPYVAKWRGARVTP